jgi:hypothetical protein
MSFPLLAPAIKCKTQYFQRWELAAISLGVGIVRRAAPNIPVSQALGAIG